MLRLIGSGIKIHFKMLSRSAFDIMMGAFWPLVFATIAYYLYRAGSSPEALFSASLGATVMAMWGSVGIGASGALQFQRRLGTLELLIGSPAPLISLLAPITISFAAIGIYSLVATIVWGRLLFGIPVHIEQPLLFALSVPTAIVAIGMLGLLVASSFVLYRAADHLGNLLEYPIWLATGLLVPLSVLPGWVTPVSWFLAPTWGMRALRASAFGGSPWPDIAMCLIVSLGYGIIAALCLRYFEVIARRKASFALS